MDSDDELFVVDVVEFGICGCDGCWYGLFCCVGIEFLLLEEWCDWFGDYGYFDGIDI